MFLNQTSEMMLWGSKRLLEKRKIKRYTIPMKVQSLSSLRSKKSMF